MDVLVDRRGHCLSIMSIMPFNKYYDLISHAYKNRGGIEGQRSTLKTSSAIRIRNRMIKDIEAGTVLPPVVIGISVNEVEFQKLINLQEEELYQFLSKNSDRLALIDGMQRTAAISEAIKKADITEYRMRVEIWVAKSINSIIYRMLILNSGQVPWDLRRQLETVFSSVTDQISKELPEVNIYTIDDGKRRRAARQYQANNILELYLVFGSRKEKIDVREKISDEFVRLDFVDLSADDKSLDLFIESIDLMSRLDAAFSRVTHTNTIRFSVGASIFGSQPACVGFVVATALLMLGRPGGNYESLNLNRRWNERKVSFLRLIQKMERMPEKDLRDFIGLQTLSEKLQQKSAKVGDFEREFFRYAFTNMYEEGEDLTTFDTCWNIY